MRARHVPVPQDAKRGQAVGRGPRVRGTAHGGVPFGTSGPAGVGEAG